MGMSLGLERMPWYSLVDNDCGSKLLRTALLLVMIRESTRFAQPHRTTGVLLFLMLVLMV